MKKTNLKAYEFQKREHKENSHYVKIEGTIYYVHDVFDAQAKETAEVSSDTSWNRKCKKFRKRLDLSDRLWYPVGSTIGLA